MRVGAREFDEVWAADFEFRAPPGERPTPHCLVARELASGRTIRLFGAELTNRVVPPFDVGPKSLFVAYYASAEMGCFLSLGWPLPENVLDLYVEFRNTTNGVPPACGCGLLGALAHFGLPAINAVEKEEMRDLAKRATTFSENERTALLDYCATDVDALQALLPKMNPYLDIERALLRGRFMKAVGRIEHEGVPIDGAALAALKANWSSIQDKLIAKIDADYGIYQGRTFKTVRFEEWLRRNSVPWPLLPTGKLDLSDDAFKEMAKAFPLVAPLRELRQSLSGMRLNDLAVGSDSRNRCLLSPFSAKTGRNQPSNSNFIFGPSVWLRGLIKPPPGQGVAYIDWSQQEFGIAAALSRDPAMMAAYQSGDPYLAFAKQAGAVPAEGTKKTHGAIRELFKTCALGVQYSMGEESLALRLGKSPAHARELLCLHRATYPTFWRWSEAAVSYAMLHGKLWTVFGWEQRVGPGVNPRSLGNFPMQANGAEMLRLACCLATERVIRVCAPVHDAILIIAPLDELDEAVAAAQAAMEETSAIVLGDFRLRSEAKIVRYPDRYMDERGKTMWDTVQELIGDQGVGQ